MTLFGQRAKIVNSNLSGSISTTQSLPRDRFREKAQKARLQSVMQRQLCARIQRVLKKSPKVAERLALQILQNHAQQGIESEKSIMEVDDEKFCALVRNIASVPCRNARSCSSLPTDGEIRDSTQLNSWSTDRPEPRDSQEKSHWDEDDVYISQAHLQQRSIGFTMTPKTRSRNRNSHNIWEDIVKYNSGMEQQERQDMKDRKMRNTSILSKELEIQVRQKQKESKLQEEENTRFHKQQQHFIEQQEVQEQKKALERLFDIKELAKSQEMQLKEKAVQKKKNLEHKKELEMRAVQRIQEEKVALEEREIAKRKAQKEQSLHVYQENQLSLSRKHIEKLKDKANDIKLAQEYTQMEERRDQQRKEHLESLSNSIKARMKMYDDTAKKDIEIKRKEEEQRLQQYQLQHAQQQAALEADEIQKRKSRNAAQKKHLRLQVQEKKEREDRDRKDFNTQAIIWKQQQEEMEVEEIAKKQKRKIDNKSQQDKLREQMLQKEKRQNWADQTLVEVQLNRPILEKIYHSSQIVQNIAQAVALETRDRSWQLRCHEAVTH